MESSILSALADDGTATVTVRGEVDFANADELVRRIRDAVADWSPARVRVDLGDASFIDSTGLGALIEGYRSVTAAEAAFVVVNPTPTFRKVLVVTGLCDFFGLPDHESDQATDREDEAGDERTQATGA
jgi:anti-sigma B factor antagonist